MHANNCKRCGGEGMGQHKHVAGGMCFECGRTPAGNGSNAPVAKVDARLRLILDIQMLLSRAKHEIAEGTVGAWWSDVMDHPDINNRARILNGPADVRDRAIAAFAKLGLTV